MKIYELSKIFPIYIYIKRERERGAKDQILHLYLLRILIYKNLSVVILRIQAFCWVMFGQEIVVNVIIISHSN
jgi:hypothetical protein